MLLMVPASRSVLLLGSVLSTVVRTGSTVTWATPARFTPAKGLIATSLAPTIGARNVSVPACCEPVADTLLPASRLICPCVVPISTLPPRTPLESAFNVPVGNSATFWPANRSMLPRTSAEGAEMLPPTWMLPESVTSWTWLAVMLWPASSARSPFCTW